MINLRTHVPGTQRYWLCISLHPVTQTLLYFAHIPGSLLQSLVDASADWSRMHLFLPDTHMGTAVSPLCLLCFFIF